MDAIYRTIAALFMSLVSAIGIQLGPATWQLQSMPDGRSVSLTISDHPHSSHGLTLPIDAFDGLRPLLSMSGQARFRLKRDAGIFEFDGVLRRGSGGGTMEFVPSESFSADLAKRCFEKPSTGEQLKMAWHDTGFALIDELAAQKYQRPTLPQLVNAGDHAIDRDYIRELAGLGYRLGTVDALIRQHDHGVNAAFIRDLSTVGLKGLSADELVRARDHGVGPEFVRQMAAAGYRGPSLTQLIAMRDHGVTPQYAKQRAPAPVDRLIALHDRGL
jgi:hypothetical protein